MTRYTGLPGEIYEYDPASVVRRELYNGPPLSVEEALEKVWGLSELAAYIGLYGCPAPGRMVQVDAGPGELP